MTRKASFLYKDAPPRDTLARIRQILERLDLLVTEDRWCHWGEYLHSVRLGLGHRCLGVNGKGLSMEAALASAYGELMERLQNQVLHRLDYYLVRALRRLRGGTGFLHAPDESSVPVSDYVQSIAPRLLRAFAPSDTRSNDHARWLELIAEDGQLTCLPYFDLVSGGKVLLPLRLVRLLHGSNGMCAGNTEREALVQGMSEIAERHAQNVIYHDGLVPPELDHALLGTSPPLSSVARMLETEFGLRLSIRDCSLGLALPVAAVIVHDSVNAGYRVAVGAHPNLDEAIARCFTEVFQGIPGPASVPLTTTTINLHRSEFDPRPGSANFESLISYGRGALPSALLYGEPSYPAALTFEPFRLTIAGAFDFLRDLLHGITGGPILVRDVSYLGFPSFHVVIPGMEPRRYTEANLRFHTDVAAVADLWIDLDRRPTADVRRVRDLLDQAVREKALDRFTAVGWVPLGPRNPWSGFSPEVVLFLLNAALGDWDAAIASLDAAASQLGTESSDDRAHRLRLAATRDFLVLTRRESLPAAKATSVLERCYGPTVARGVAETWAGDVRPLEKLPFPRCFRCGECELAPSCDFPLWERIHEALRDAMLKPMPPPGFIRATDSSAIP